MYPITCATEYFHAPHSRASAACDARPGLAPASPGLLPMLPPWRLRHESHIVLKRLPCPVALDEGRPVVHED
jgi:hypothetical protein